MMTTVTVGISAIIGRIGEFTATSAKPTGAHMRKASTVAPSTALITGRCGTLHGDFHGSHPGTRHDHAEWRRYWYQHHYGHGNPYRYRYRSSYEY